MRAWLGLGLCWALFCVGLRAGLKPGFDPNEARHALLLSAHSTRMFGLYRTLPKPEGFTLGYRSKTSGLDNAWDVWIGPDSLCLLSIRGSTQRLSSWVANFYAAMVPATGTLVLDAGHSEDYRLSDHPKAAVHAGWLYCLLSMRSSLEEVLDSLHGKGYRNLLLTGHSQGGAIANLLSAHLRMCQETGQFPRDWKVKTYATAPPKPGNLPFAHSYARLHAGGWSWNLILTADWVPETPMTIQTLDDFTWVNPFGHTHFVDQRAPFPFSQVYGLLVGLLDAPGQKAMRRYRFFLGTLPEKYVSNTYSGYEPPAYEQGMNYVRAGETRYLFCDSTYFKAFPDDPNRPFIHHLAGAYLYLLYKQEGISNQGLIGK